MSGPVVLGNTAYLSCSNFDGLLIGSEEVRKLSARFPLINFLMPSMSIPVS